jgi:hypothetical protein
VRLHPTRSRSREELVLQTYGDENDSLEVGDDGAARLVFNDGGGCSSFKSCFSGGGGGRVPRPKLWISSKRSGKVMRRWRIAR